MCARLRVFHNSSSVVAFMSTVVCVFVCVLKQEFGGATALGLETRTSCIFLTHPLFYRWMLLCHFPRLHKHNSVTGSALLLSVTSSLSVSLGQCVFKCRYSENRGSYFSLNVVRADITTASTQETAACVGSSYFKSSPSNWNDSQSMQMSAKWRGEPHMQI